MKPTTRYRTANPTATAPAHSGIAVDLPIGGGHSADRVKAAVADQLRSECGADHYVAARRINRQNSTVLHWSITAHCWPTDPAAAPQTKADLAGLPTTAGVLRPADPAAAETQADRFQTAIAEMAVDHTLRSRGLK